MPRWLREPSRFAEAFGPAVRHLPRIPFNKLTRFWKASAFSYLERTAWSARTAGLAALAAADRARLRAPSTCATRSAPTGWPARARCTGAPLVYEVHDLEADQPLARRGRALGALAPRAMDRVTIRRPARLVSLTATFRDFLAARGLRAAGRRGRDPRRL